MPKSSFHHYRLPILLSVVFHVAVLAILFLWYRSEKEKVAQPKPTHPSHTSVRPSVVDIPSSIPNTKDIDVPPEQIKSSIDSKIAQVAAVSDEVKRNQLDKDLKRLDQVCDQDSVNQVADAVAKSMGIDQSQYADKPELFEGDFDHKTAQIKTVTRSKNEIGKWDYVATMVDEEGHQLETPLSESEGASVYETFEKLKQYPIAEGLYQKIIMPMLQKMIESESAR